MISTVTTIRTFQKQGLRIRFEIFVLITLTIAIVYKSNTKFRAQRYCAPTGKGVILFYGLHSDFPLPVLIAPKSVSTLTHLIVT